MLFFSPSMRIVLYLLLFSYLLPSVACEKKSNFLLIISACLFYLVQTFNIFGNSSFPFLSLSINKCSSPQLCPSIPANMHQPLYPLCVDVLVYTKKIVDFFQFNFIICSSSTDCFVTYSHLKMFRKVFISI